MLPGSVSEDGSTATPKEASHDELSPRSKVFDEAASLQRAEPGSQKAAEHVHTFLPPQFWGISRKQLDDFVKEVRKVIQGGELTNPSKQDCIEMGHPERHYEQKNFENLSIGPNAHQINSKFIVPRTKGGDSIHNICNLSYACMVNSKNGLLCDLFISHAWDEGIFEFAALVLNAWPEHCSGAYICFLSNPQNLLDLIGKQIKSPSTSPFYKVLKNGPSMMMMVPNSNTAIHSRLWCVYEAYCAVDLRIPVSIAGDSMLMITDAKALQEASATELRKQRNRIFLLAFFVIGVMFAPPLAIIFPFLWCWIIKNEEKQEEVEREAKLKVVDVKLAKCSVASDQEAIQKEIKGSEERINSMIRGFIPKVSAVKAPPSMLLRCCCPPCSVLVHEGPGCDLCLATFLCQWFTVLCWSPKVFGSAGSWEVDLEMAVVPQQQKIHQ